jgi:raffinose/stachyose/melibiose transport system substrate-binding protein
MPLPLSTDAKAYGNDSISVGVPGYFMVDKEQSTAEERAGAINFLEWLMTTAKGQQHVSGAVEDGGMNFIPAYKGFKVSPKTFMAKAIAGYVSKGKTLEWINSYYPAGGQNLYGASSQKYITGKIDASAYAAEIEAAWKGAVKTWRGESK